MQLVSLLMLAALLPSSLAFGGRNIPCGTSFQGSRIVGGQQARPGVWPWQVLIDWKKDPAKYWCGGTIVSPQWIVSAAHCFDKDRNVRQYTLVAGEYNLNRRDGSEQNIPIQRLIIHPRYDRRTNDYDVAMIKLKYPLRYNNRVRPVCLTRSRFRANTRCFVTGWGDTREGSGVGSAILRQARVPLVSRFTCQRAYPWDNITPRMLCAGYSGGRIDACDGDSGGPLVCPRRGRWYLAGAVSWGDGCAGRNQNH